VAVLWAFEEDGGGRGRDFCGLAFAQAALLLMNRLLAGRNGSETKALHPGLLQHLAAPYAIKTAVAAAILLVLRRMGVLSRRGLFPLLFLCLGSAVLSSVLFAAAGYNMTPAGISSRAFLAVNLWIAAALGWIFSVLAVRRPAFARWTLLPLAAALAVSQAFALGHWEASWASQQRVLDRVPYPALEALPSGAILVADLPPSDDVVGDFVDPWDLAGAIMARDPAVRTDSSSSPRPVLLVTELRHWNFYTTWDGTHLAQAVRGGDRLGTFKADHAYLWRYPDPKLVELPAGWTDR
jgi:hypothetical protein